jgi:hypothetical protein
VQHALSKGLGVGIVVEKRLPFTAAFDAGGERFGTEIKSTLSIYPGIKGVIFDFERGHDASIPVPSQDAYANFLHGVHNTIKPLSLIIAGSSSSQPFTMNFTKLLVTGGANGVDDMGTYHGISTHDWAQKLNQSIENAAAGGAANPQDTLQVGLALVPKAGNTWELSVESVQDRFAAIKAAGLPQVHVFSWPPWPWSQTPLLPADTLAEWTKQLAAFGTGE